MIGQEEQVEERREEGVEIEKLPPQVRIYNRNFYLRNARQQDLQDEVNRQIQQLASKPKLTPNSYIILVQKLQHQLNELLQKHIEKAEHLDFQDFQGILNQMGRFSAISKQKQQLEIELMLTQFWLLLIDYDLSQKQISKNKFISLMHILFCPYTLKTQELIALIQHAFPNIQENKGRYLQEHPESEEEILGTEELLKLWLKIKRTYLCSFNQDKKEAVAQKTPSFKPEISTKSKQYAKRQLEKYLSNNKLDNIKTSKLNELSGYISGGKEMSYHDILYKRGLEKEQLLKTSRQRADSMVDKSKVLTDEQTKRLVENLYIVKERKQDLDYSKLKEDQQLKLCTFHPATIEYHKRSATPSIRNYQKQIDRLQKGRRDKLKLQEAYQNLGKVKSRYSGPPSMVEREKPKLILEIRVGEKIVKLKLKGDEQPKIMAKKFVNKYDLDESMQEVLCSVIEEQLAAL